MKTKIYLFSILVFTLFGCSKYLDLESPNDITEQSFYKTEKDAFEATMAMYSNIQHLNYYGRDYFHLAEYPSDDVTGKFAFNALDAFSWSAINGAQGTADIENVYAWIFEGIFRTNIVLEKVAADRIDKEPKIPFKNEDDRNNILAEAYFLRGLHYFNGASLFGGIAILTETPKENKLGGILYTKRSTREQTFERAILDVKSAIGEGTDTKITLPTSWSDANKGRATKYAGYALLGKIYLHAACYLKKPEYFVESAKYLKLVIESGKFQLLPKYKDVFSSFNKHNAEGVFEIGYGYRGENGFYHDGGTAGENTQRDLRFGPQKAGSGFGEIIATRNWMLESEFGDPRVREFLFFTWDTLDIPSPDNKRKSIVYSEIVATTVRESGENVPGSFFHVKKAVDGFEAGGSGGLNGSNNWRLIRYADVLLMYAEVLNELGNQAEAITYINKTRERARNSVPVIAGSKVFRSAQILSTKRSKVAVGDYTGLYGETTISGGKHEVDPALDILANYPCSFGVNYGGLIDLSGNDKEAVRNMIVRERRAELAFEYLRFLDMRRWEAYDATHPGAASTVFGSKDIGNSLAGGSDRQPYNKAIHNLFPIPQQQIDISGNTTTQNPGY